MTINEYSKIEYKEKDGLIYVSIDNDSQIFEPFESMIDAQDTAEDFVKDEMRQHFRFYCSFCQEFLNETDVEHRLEDSRFSAPFGSTIVWGGDVETIPVCPFCGDDLEDA